MIHFTLLSSRCRYLYVVQHIEKVLTIIQLKLFNKFTFWRDLICSVELKNGYCNKNEYTVYIFLQYAVITKYCSITKNAIV